MKSVKSARYAATRAPRALTAIVAAAIVAACAQGASDDGSGDPGGGVGSTTGGTATTGGGNETTTGGKATTGGGTETTTGGDTTTGGTGTTGGATTGGGTTGGATTGGATTGGATTGGATTGGTTCVTVPGGTCGITPQCGCGSNQTCVVSPNAGAVACAAAGSTAVGKPCTANTDCSAGNACVFSACRPYCTPVGSACPGTGGVCEQVYSSSGTAIPNLKVCSIKCDVLSATACGTGNGCTWTTGIGVDCEKVGTGTRGGTCTYDTDCKAGLKCDSVFNQCLKWCRVGNASDCSGTGGSCLSEGVVIDGVTYGTCF